MQNTIFGKPERIKTETLFSDSPNIDTFGNLRVSTPTAVFDNQMTYDLSPLVYEQITSGTGATITHDATNRMAVMSFSSSPILSKSYMQTYETFRYQPFRSQEIALTFNFKEHTDGVYKWVGYSDGVNGFEFGSDGSNGFCLKILSGTSNGDQVVYQDDWNYDRFDSTGISGLELDVASTNILLISFQSLYVGKVTFSLYINGKIHVLHNFYNANRIMYPYIQTANLPVSAGMITSGTATTQMFFICSAVVTRSGSDEIAGHPFEVTGAGTAGNGVYSHILTVRPKLLFNNIVNRTQIKNLGLDLYIKGNSAIDYKLVIGQALVGTPTFTDVNTTYSAFEYVAGVSATLSGAYAISFDAGHVPASAQIKGSVSLSIDNKYPITLNAAGQNRTMGQITLIAKGKTGSSDIDATLTWKEIR